MPTNLNRPRGYAIIGLNQPKLAVNIGAVLRAAGCFGAAMTVVSGRRYVRSGTDTMKAYRHLPLLHVDDILDSVPFDCVPVAIDLVPGAVSLYDYVHPERAYYIFGAEDQTLGSRIIERCRDTIYIPMTSGCLNLAMCVNVVLYDRSMKMQKPRRENPDYPNSYK